MKLSKQEQDVLIAAVDLVNQWRRIGRWTLEGSLVNLELELWRKVDRMQDEKTAPPRRRVK